MSIYRVKLAEETQKVSDKSKKPFDPNVPDPEFDPSADASTTIPSEITALTKEQQKHVMKSAKKHNQPGYKYYLLNKAETKIRSGWEYLEDAKDAKKDDPESGKILQTKGLKALGIDPNDNKCWGSSHDASVKKPILVGKEMKTSMKYLATTQAREDVFYAEEEEKID